MLQSYPALIFLANLSVTSVYFTVLYDPLLCKMILFWLVCRLSVWDVSHEQVLRTEAILEEHETGWHSSS